jgi:hypothetical protein
MEVVQQVETQVCYACHIPKPFGDFYLRKIGKTNRLGICKLCSRQCAQRSYRSRHPLPASGVLCGKLSRRGVMTEERPCVSFKNHRGMCHPDISNMQFGQGHTLNRAEDYLSGGHLIPTKMWHYVFDTTGVQTAIRASQLIHGRFKGVHPPRREARTDFYNSAHDHYFSAHHSTSPHYTLYRFMMFHPEWDLGKGLKTAASVFASNAEQWAIKNQMAQRPEPGRQLHVRKTSKHPFGYFGPGGVIWAARVDVHDRQFIRDAVNTLREYATNGTAMHQEIIQETEIEQELVEWFRRLGYRIERPDESQSMAA